ncbi:Putative acyl-CoA N-acyltransferase [Septoria linicola]|uniref:Acyl-CoA N-acyltransferase n=1 Tax=Septoria linicola TaxID=215465 RepID=A0A9Q9B2A9_9PEZI|nr:Putative acyl-CoA N-acyltransferase [Septoria linicola]
MPPRFHIRPVSSALDDGLRIINFVDSQLPFLARVGSEGQWGSDLLSGDAEKQQGYRKMVKCAESQHPWGEQWTRAFVAEVELDRDTWPDELHNLSRPNYAPGTSGSESYLLPVAAIVLEDHAEDYVHEVLPKRNTDNPFVYVRFLVTDRRTGQLSKDAATALLDYAKAAARSLNISRLCLDCWSGNDRKLVRYYEKHSFHLLGDVMHDDWPAAILECRI